MKTSLIPTPMVRALRMLLGTRARPFAPFHEVVENKIGLEIGGPSAVFSDRGILPLYCHASRIDNCVYASQTMWGNESKEGRTFQYHNLKPVGLNFIQEATCLPGIANGSYDFILSSHSLEHIANPVRALKEWIRITKPGGAFVIVLPHFKYTFDRRRQVTQVSHMLEDYERGTDEDDETHLPDILQFHDLALHPEPISREQLRVGILDNLRTRCAHHHVFDERNSSELLEKCGLWIKSVQYIRPYHIVLLAIKPAGSSRV
jgi:SAM-dependent methyltransferase